MDQTLLCDTPALGLTELVAVADFNGDGRVDLIAVVPEPNDNHYIDPATGVCPEDQRDRYHRKAHVDQQGAPEEPIIGDRAKTRQGRKDSADRIGERQATRHLQTTGQHHWTAGPGDRIDGVRHNHLEGAGVGQDRRETVV